MAPLAQAPAIHQLPRRYERVRLLQAVGENTLRMPRRHMREADEVGRLDDPPDNFAAVLRHKLQLHRVSPFRRGVACSRFAASEMCSMPAPWDTPFWARAFGAMSRSSRGVGTCFVFAHSRM